MMSDIKGTFIGAHVSIRIGVRESFTLANLLSDLLDEVAHNKQFPINEFEYEIIDDIIRALDEAPKENDDPFAELASL